MNYNFKLLKQKYFYLGSNSLWRFLKNLIRIFVWSICSENVNNKFNVSINLKITDNN